MFATRLFPNRYFAPRYFPKVGATSTGVNLRRLLFWRAGSRSVSKG